MAEIDGAGGQDPFAVPAADPVVEPVVMDAAPPPAVVDGGLDFVRECITELEEVPVLTATCLAEPQLGRRDLYHSMLNKNTSDIVMLRTNILAYSDGTHTVQDISELLGEPLGTVESVTKELVQRHLVTSDLQHS